MNIVKYINKNNIAILFAGNSGDGIQFIGRQFTDTSVIIGNNVSTFSDFPSEIRSPKDTISGISGFQIHFGNIEINSPGDMCDVLVIMNAASLKKYLKKLKNKGIIIADKSGFTNKKVLLAGYKNEINPLKNIFNHKIYEIDFSLHVNNIVKNFPSEYKNKIKNIFILGFIYSIYQYPIDYTEFFIKKKFEKNINNILNANINALKAGYNFGIKNKINIGYFNFKKNISNNKIRNINGNDAIVLGLISGCKKAGVKLFYSSYPITPASDIFHNLASLKNFKVQIFQAEDEIAAISSAIGASYAGSLGITATSGPGMSLKQEAIGLAVMLEIPLVIINVQRAGPSTGLPTKTEQSDLMQAIYGRNGECPIPILSSHSPSHCFYMAYNAVKIAIEHMTPVILLSEACLANGSESYKFPGISNMPNINIPKFNKKNEKIYYPYLRDNRGVRSWIIPGMKGYQHRIGSLEKENLTGNVSSDPINHELMIKLRQKKIDNIANYFSQNFIDNILLKKTKILLLGWGSTYGVLREACKQLINESYSIYHIHIDYIYPFPIELDKIISSFKKIIIPELNNGQFIKLIRNKYLRNIYPINKIQGIPFTVSEIINEVKKISLIND